MSQLRVTLIALLVASTALFAIGVAAERSDGYTHVEPAAGQVEKRSGEPEGAHADSGESGSGEAEEGHAEPAAAETHSDQDEGLLGVDPESTPLVVLAVLAGLGLAALTATRFGRLRGFLLAVAVIALVWAVLDVREVIHQLDESRTGIAVIASAVAALHLAVVAVSGRLARRPAPP